MSSRYSAIYAFGDSLSDGGNDSIVTGASNLIGATARIPTSPPYYQTSYGPFGTLNANVFSNGPVWVQDLSNALGIGTLAPSLYSGTDFAYGGSEANPTESGISGIGASAISLSSQLVQFGGTADPNGLYTLSIGTNDIQTILTTSGLDYAHQVQQVGQSVSSEVSFVSSLIDAGARTFYVLDVPDMSKLPVVTLHDSPSQIALAGQLANLYDVEANAGLENLAASRGVTIDILPLYSLTDQVAVNPSAFGLTNVTAPAWSGTYSDSSSGTVAANPNSYLFWDQYHPTGTVHQLIANDANAQLTTGSQLYPAVTIGMTDTTTGQSSTQYSTAYSGPVASLQNQFISPITDNVALTANGPNMFLKGGAGNDALQTRGGTNVLDGGTGSNFLSGTPYSTDTFFVDGTGGGVTWSTILHFHAGDAATLFGFQAGVSTMTSSAVDGAAGYQGVTFNVALNGASTGVNASLTLTGIDPGTVAAHCTLSVGSTSGVSYLQIQYDH